MEVVSPYKWFSAVWWAERCCLVDCLVDVTDNILTSGSYLLAVSDSLVIYSSSDLLSKKLLSISIIVGRVIKRDCPLS